jgi:hypothetical protein
MIETQPREAPSDPVPTADAAAYLFDLCGELAGLARQAGLGKTAGALDQARAFAAEAVLTQRRET